jgi:UDP-2,4-diacetamido-2,4,6-trideoxy-beta-L-altropyranose hydrolase
MASEMSLARTPMTLETLLVRADATVAMGTGHVMRCLALAQAWQDSGGRAVFAMADAPRSLRERLLAEKMDVAPIEASRGGGDDVRKVAELAGRHAASWVVVDGYHFGAAYQRDLKAAGLKLLFVDDHGHAGHHSADLVLNQNVYADRSFYQDTEPYTRLLLGPRYVLLRREFARWGEWKREIAPVGGKVLVTMGGSDPGNITARVIEALGLVRVEGLEATVVVGGSNPHSDFLRRAVARFVGKIHIQKDVPNMPELMAWADVAVSAAGTTCWELCLLGLPAILIDLAENQRPIAEALTWKKCAIHLGGTSEVATEKMAASLEWLLLSPATRTAISRRARELVDTNGAIRVVSAIRTGNAHLRRRKQEDCGSPLRSL